MELVGEFLVIKKASQQIVVGMLRGLALHLQVPSIGKVLTIGASALLAIIQQLLLPCFRSVPHGPVNHAVHHAEDRDPRVLLWRRGMPFRDHKGLHVQVSFWQRPERNCYVFNVGCILPSLLKQESESNPGPPVKTNR